VSEAARYLASVPSRLETRCNTDRRGFIMFAIGGRIDEFRFVDDSVDVAVLAREAKEAFERPALAVQPILRPSKGRTDRVAHLRRHVAHQRLEQGLLRIEVGIEGAERDPGSLRDSDNRAVGKAPLAELLASGIKDLAKRPLAARGPRGFSGGGA